MDGSTLIGTVAVNSTTDKAIAYIPSLPAGFDYITARYNGASGFATSSNSLIETVNAAAATTTTLTASSSTINAGQLVAFVATVTSGSGSPTGTVTFMDDSTLIGSVAINSATHQAIAYTPSLPAGSDDITASYNGDGGFATSSNSLTETVNAAAATTTTLTASSNPITPGQLVAFTATVTSDSGSPTGTVTFMDGSTLIGTVAINSDTQEAIAYTASLPVGSQDITASYNGASAFAASSSSLIETVSATAATTTTLAASSNPITPGQLVAFTATVTAASGSPTGTVTFMDGSTLIGTVAINSTTHKAIAYTPSLAAGFDYITASYNGASGFATSSNSLIETVNSAAATTTTLTASSTSITAGQLVAFTATVTSASGSPTGTVTFMDGSTLIGTVAINSTTHKAIGYTSSLSQGSHHITATYNGTTAFATSSASLTESVSLATTTTTVTSSAASAVLARR